MSNADHGRYCDSCKRDHGPLYVCESYSPELKAELATRTERLRANFRDQAWRAEQVQRLGISERELTIFGWFLGDSDDERPAT